MIRRVEMIGYMMTIVSDSLKQFLTMHNNPSPIPSRPHPPRPSRPPVPLLPPLGLACFVYLVMVEGMEHSYLPTVVRQGYLLYINLIHVTTLLGRY